MTNLTETRTRDNTPRISGRYVFVEIKTSKLFLSSDGVVFHGLDDKGFVMGINYFNKYDPYNDFNYLGELE